jgi:cytoskeletal protein CcmA (bactofilin family)
MTEAASLMFSKAKPDPISPKPDVAPNREAPQIDEQRSILLKGTSIKGDFASDGIVDLGGSIFGELTAETLVVTKSGKVEGGIHAASVIVEGEVDGIIHATSLTIKPGARVKADIITAAISVDFGAMIEGRIKMPVQPVVPVQESGSPVE